MVFEVNVGDLDRALRVVLGLSLVGPTLAEGLGAWGWLGMFPLLTASLGVCPVYRLLGIHTTTLITPAPRAPADPADRARA
jgi:hypothetical protein